MFHRINHTHRPAYTNNYARHVGRDAVLQGMKIIAPAVLGTGELVFFGFDTPYFEDESQWAFWAMPSDAELETFKGQFIGR